MKLWIAAAVAVASFVALGWVVSKEFQGANTQRGEISEVILQQRAQECQSQRQRLVEGRQRARAQKYVIRILSDGFENAGGISQPRAYAKRVVRGLDDWHERIDIIPIPNCATQLRKLKESLP